MDSFMHGDSILCNVCIREIDYTDKSVSRGIVKVWFVECGKVVPADEVECVLGQISINLFAVMN